VLHAAEKQHRSEHKAWIFHSYLLSWFGQCLRFGGAASILPKSVRLLPKAADSSATASASPHRFCRRELGEFLGRNRAERAGRRIAGVKSAETHERLEIGTAEDICLKEDVIDGEFRVAGRTVRENAANGATQHAAFLRLIVQNRPEAGQAEMAGRSGCSGFPPVAR
jgi:hypothetical protein